MVPHKTDGPASFSKAKSGPTINGNVISIAKAKGNRLIHPGVPDTDTPQLHDPLWRRRGPCSTKCELLSVGFPGVEIEGIMLTYLCSCVGSPLSPLIRPLAGLIMSCVQHSG